jgi:hypothetical protein
VELRRGRAQALIRSRRLAVAALALAALVLLAAPAGAGAQVTQPKSQTEPPPLFERSAREAVRIAARDQNVRDTRREHPRLRGVAYVDGSDWQVSWFARGDELVQVHVDDRTGRIEESWTGDQVAWKMARGYEGAFGRKVNAPYVWIPLCLLFLAPFVDPRRPFRLVHLDLLVLLAFGLSHVYFNRGEIGLSVPLVYPVLAYVLARMLWAGFRPRTRAGPLVPLVPVTWLVLGIVFLAGFRVALNVTDSNVIDVGYAGVIGADRIADGSPLYEGGFPRDNEHGDTYGPANYLIYLPAEQLLPWSGRWDDLPAAHAAALAFDLLTLAGLILLGRRLRAGREGRDLGIALGYAWVSYPYALFALQSNTNDTLVALLAVGALLALGSPAGRGAITGVAAAAKFASGALAPLFAAGRGERRWRSGALFAVAFVVVAAVLFLPFLPDGGVGEIWDRTIGYQAERGTPFSLWGQADGLGWLQAVVMVAAAGLALLVFFLPRRRSPLQVAALAAAVLVGVQMAADYWFYLYVVWFAPLVFVAAFGTQERVTPPAPRESEPEAAREPVAA